MCVCVRVWGPRRDERGTKPRAGRAESGLAEQTRNKSLHSDVPARWMNVLLSPSALCDVTTGHDASEGLVTLVLTITERPPSLCVCCKQKAKRAGSRIAYFNGFVFRWRWFCFSYSCAAPPLESGIGPLPLWLVIKTQDSCKQRANYAVLQKTPEFFPPIVGFFL